MSPVTARLTAGGSREHLMPRSGTDVIFLALCHEWARPEHAPPLAEGEDDRLSIEWVGDTFRQMQILACQHTAQSRAYWPTEQQWARLKHCLARVVVTYFDHSPQRHVQWVEQLDKHVFRGLDPARDEDQRWLECVTPALLREEMEAAANKARRETEEEGAEPLREDAAEEAAGSLWRSSADELANNYVRLASRLVYVVDLQHDLLHLYPATHGVAAPRFTAATYQRMYAWLVRRCAIELGEKTTEMFRDTANLWWTPLGAETHQFRDKESRDENPRPLQVFESEVGVRLGQHMHQRSGTKFVAADVAAAFPGSPTAAGPCGIFWAPLFVAVFHTHVMQATRCNWAGKFVVSAVPHSRKWRERMEAEHIYGCDPRPLMLPDLARRFWVFHHKQLLPCQSFAHMFLTWCWLMLGDEFHGETENCEELAPVLSQFVNHTSIQSAAPS